MERCILVSTSLRGTLFREFALRSLRILEVNRSHRYVVVVKVGKPTERSKPGNRGKRDSQILLMHYLNRVHFDAPMSPLELEIYHQMRNVIGIDPAFYEYIFTVDADTVSQIHSHSLVLALTRGQTVTPESLNRLVATTADDSSIIGVCGETKLENEETSWWTMIQVRNEVAQLGDES